MIPTKQRNQSSFLIRYNTEGILFDCGEGTQRQIKLAGIPLTKITRVLITHWHGDHTLGLAGLVQSLGASEYNKTLVIYGPKGTGERMNHMFKAFVFDRRTKLEIKEITDGIFFENDEFALEALRLKHGIPIYGYSFIEKDRRKIDLKKVEKLGIPRGPLLGKLQDGNQIIWKDKTISPDEATYIVNGKKITYITDTVLCDACYKLAENSDVLICEATYGAKLEQKSEEYGHMTSKQAAMIANSSNVKKLILTHFSARYKNTHELESEARDIFDNVISANDFMEIKL